MYNKAIIIGRMTKDIELRYTTSGKAVGDFTLAVNNGKDKAADFIDCTVWNKLAELCKQYTAKGSKLLVEGKISVDNYTNSNGDKRKSFKIIANNIRFLSKSNNAANDTPQDGSEEEVPF
jgi:single-strand DNA-binding protein